MEIKEIKDKNIWEGFFQSFSDKTFLQSWNWGEFQLLQVGKIWRLGMYKDSDLVGATLVVKISARRGTFLFIPHGPIVKQGFRKEGLQALVNELKNLAKEENASFLRFSPFWLMHSENENLFKNLGFRLSPIHMHAESTWELDITKSEEELLAQMRKTTRYLIKQAQKNLDIEIIKSEDVEDLKKFMPVYLSTAKRHKFVIFSEKYLKNEFLAFKKDKQIMFFFGKYKEEVVSVAVFVFWQNGAFYHHSGSLIKYNKIPVSYLLQWEAIKEAKARGCSIYNFWGVSPDIKEAEDAKTSKHPWAGLSLFKMGFGGYLRNLVKTQDYVLSNKYLINYLIESFRKLKRGL